MQLDLATLEVHHKALRIDFSLFDEVKSTNDEAFKALEKSPFCAVVAKKQNAGRGRLGRKWEGNEGDCIFYSAGFVVPENFNIEILTCAIAIEILKLIDEKEEHDLAIKWPNDIYYQGRKLCGILTESKAKNGRIESVVIGIGFNVEMPIDSSSFKREPAWLRELSNLAIEDTILALSWAVKLVYEKLSADYENFAQEFEKKDYLKGRQVSINKGEDVLVGLSLGVDNSAKLKFLEQSENKIHLVNAGEVSIL
ncbi:MAG: biotin--[acetyl-CoA-carboxylase] ligase [Opitutales bacterium]